MDSTQDVHASLCIDHKEQTEKTRENNMHLSSKSPCGEGKTSVLISLFFLSREKLSYFSLELANKRTTRWVGLESSELSQECSSSSGKPRS
jgi:hypothetical protein